MSVTAIDDDDDKWQARFAAATPAQLNAMFLETARTGDVARAKLLLSAGAELAHNSGHALVLAASRGGPDMLEFILAEGIAAQAPDCRHDALAEAVHYNRKDAVRRLLTAGASPAALDSAALFFAAQRSDGEMMEMLLRAGGNATARQGTLLPVALAHRNEEAAMRLLRHGADPAAYYRGMNGFEWTAEMGLPGFAAVLRQWLTEDGDIPRAFFENKTLEELRAPLPARQGRSGIHLAAGSGNFDVVRNLVLSSPADSLRAGDILQTATGAPGVLNLLGQRNQLHLLLDAALWRGRKAEALQVLREVPAAYNSQIDVAAFAAALDHHVLKSAAPKFRLDR